MNDCIFCKIISGEIPCQKTYEDKDFLAFLDISPVSKGHTLLIPKTHYTWMHETPDDVISGIFILTKKMMNTIREKMPCDYVQVSVVGKDVPHLHIHLIPRFLGDNLPQFPVIKYESQEEIALITEKLKNPQ